MSEATFDKLAGGLDCDREIIVVLSEELVWKLKSLEMCGANLSAFIGLALLRETARHLMLKGRIALAADLAKSIGATKEAIISERRAAEWKAYYEGRAAMPSQPVDLDELQGRQIADSIFRQLFSFHPVPRKPSKAGQSVRRSRPNATKTRQGHKTRKI